MTSREMMEEIARSVDDRREGQVYTEEDAMFERFEMLDDETNTGDPLPDPEKPDIPLQS